MNDCIQSIVCTAYKGQNINDFASVLVNLNKENPESIVGVFNDIALFVHKGDTEEDIVKRYFSMR